MCTKKVSGVVRVAEIDVRVAEIDVRVAEKSGVCVFRPLNKYESGRLFFGGGGDLYIYIY